MVVLNLLRTQLPYSSPGWDAAGRRNNELTDSLGGGGGSVSTPSLTLLDSGVIATGATASTVYTLSNPGLYIICAFNSNIGTTLTAGDLVANNIKISFPLPSGQGRAELVSPVPSLANQGTAANLLFFQPSSVFSSAIINITAFSDEEGGDLTQVSVNTDGTLVASHTVTPSNTNGGWAVFSVSYS